MTTWKHGKSQKTFSVCFVILDLFYQKDTSLSVDYKGIRSHCSPRWNGTIVVFWATNKVSHIQCFRDVSNIMSIISNMSDFSHHCCSTLGGETNAAQLEILHFSNTDAVSIFLSPSPSCFMLNISFSPALFSGYRRQEVLRAVLQLSIAQLVLIT